MARLASLACIAVILVGATTASAVQMLNPYIEAKASYTKLAASQASALYQINVPGSTAAGESYATPPLLVDLHGTRHDIGYDYAALLHNQTLDTFNAFMSSLFPSAKDRQLLMNFTEFLWDNYYVTYQPPQFAAELAGMAAYYEEHGKPAPVPGSYITVDMVERHFLVLANMPADEQNIIAALEQEFEKGWPVWLKDVINEIIKLVLHLKPGCDAYGVWGSRTKDSLLYSSRNLDYNSDTGINRNKLVIMYHVDDPSFGGKPAGGMYASLGFAFGLGALAGMNEVGITTSEMNLDNDVVTFSGVPFPWRLRLVLEGATDLHSAMNVWNATNNTNSFNFLVASAPDALRIKQEEELGVAAPGAGSAAFALETIMGFTAVFPANSTVELDATYDCVGDACKEWTTQTGIVHIGKPIPEAVWRTNHGLAPRVMATQEPLFNNTVFRYDLMNHLFVSLAEEGQLIDDTTAVQVVSTLGIKGLNYLTCDQDLDGDNIMSIAYAPGPRDGTTTGVGHLYIAWESFSGAAWRPAACSPYVPIDFADWV